MKTRLLCVLVALVLAQSAVCRGHLPFSGCDNNQHILPGQRCDGRDDCGDSSDESPVLCSAHHVLAVYHNLTVHVQLKRPHQGVTFVLSNDDKDSRVLVPLKMHPENGSLTYMPEPARDEKVRNYSEPSLAVTRDEVGEAVFVVERRRSELAVWLQTNPSVKVTVPLKTDRLANLTVLPYTGTSKMEVRFKAPTVAEMVGDLDAALRIRNASKPCSEDCLARLNSKVDMATFSKGHPRNLDADENWAIDWMHVAVASVSTSAWSAMPLENDFFTNHQFTLSETNSKRRQNNAMVYGKRNIHIIIRYLFVERYTAENKLIETLYYYKRLNMMKVNETITSVENRSLSLNENASAELGTLLKKQKAELNFQKALSAVVACISAVAVLSRNAVTAGVGNILYESAGTYVWSETLKDGSGVVLHNLKENIGDLIEDISKFNETQEDFRFVLPMLTRSKELFAKFKEAAGKNQTWVWLTSFEMKTFQAELLSLPIENFKVAMSQSNMVTLLKQMTTTLADALDAVHTFIFQRTTMALLRFTLYDQNTSPLALGVTSLQEVVGQNTLANYFSATQLTVGLSAFPYCITSPLVSTDRCLSQPLGSAMAQCMIDELIDMEVTFEYRIKHLFNGDDSIYHWQYAKHNATIKALLSGEEVILNADVSKSNESMNAIKYGEMILLFRHTNPEKERELANALKCARVRMVHSGMSNFRCAQGAVSFKHPSFPIDYEYSSDCIRTKKCYCTNENTVFLIFSPYTSWRVQLSAKLDENEECLLNIKKLANEPFNVTLEGWGTYVETPFNCDVCGGKIDEGVGNSNGPMRRDDSFAG